MSEFIPWNSQPLDDWAGKHAKGTFVDLNGHKTHYIEKGEGEPVILLHGFFYDSYIWDQNIDTFSKKFKVYALDLWGFGYSTREHLDFGYPLYVDQLLRFMDYLGLSKASLVGQSMGGGLSIKFSVLHTEKVNKLLLVDPAGMPLELPLIGKFFNIPKVGEFLLGLKTNAIRKMNLADLWIYDKKNITESYFESVTRFHKIKGTTECLMAVLRKQFIHTLHDEIHKLANLNIPTLIVWGKHDKAIPLERGEAMHQILKGSRLEILDRAGHVPNYERADEFNKLSLDFLGLN